MGDSGLEFSLDLMMGLALSLFKILAGAQPKQMTTLMQMKLSSNKIAFQIEGLVVIFNLKSG